MGVLRFSCPTAQPSTGCFYKWGVLVLSVLAIRALLLWAFISQDPPTTLN